MPTCDKCNSHKKLELHQFERESELWAYCDCLQCHWRFEFKEVIHEPGGEHVFERAGEGYPIPDDG